MNDTEAWVLAIGEDKHPPPATLERGSIALGELGPDEVLVEPLLVGWEGNCHHAVQRRPVDVCRIRGEQRVVIGNAGVVRVLKPGPEVRHLHEGDVCLVWGNYKPDPAGFVDHGGAYAYDAVGSIGLLAKRTRILGRCLLPLPAGTRYSVAQWAAFSIRYITAWANWRMALGVWRLQTPEDNEYSPNVVGWGGGTTFAELTLARRMGARAAIASSQPSRFKLAEASGLHAIDRRKFPDIEFDERKLSEPGYEARYRASERIFLEAVREATGGKGVDIFVDYVGAPLFRATLRSLARQGVVTSAGWREGPRMSFIRSIECIQRHQYVHTHYARRSEAVAAMAFAEATGWMPPLDLGATWSYDRVPELATTYAAGGIESYFPLIEVNRGGSAS
jgi:NADPH:quinone reductase-like Zn-dependent oxidoreductase